jgi:hypothetical protein
LDENGVASHVSVDWLALADSPLLSSTYNGLRGFAYDMRIVAKAREINSPYQIVARNRQNLELSIVTIFQFAVFYNVDLEINPSPAMTITGPVHCNANVYLNPSSALVFQDHLTAAGQIKQTRKPGDPSSSSTSGTVSFLGKPAPGFSANFLSLNLPIGTTNTSASAHQIIEVPPTGEAISSMVGQQRYYNKADMVILVSDSGTTVTSGAIDGFATVVPTNEAKLFVNTTSFFNARENKTIKCTDLDVGKLREWNTSNTAFRVPWPLLDVATVFIADTRSQSGSTEPGVRLINGEWLPPKGLTVATPDPIYIKGNYNVTTNGTPMNLGTADTTYALPASVAADAVSILSVSWSDANSSLALSSRIAGSTTVNCAILAGNVPTTSSAYSGGLENFPRFLEDWSGKTFTYNGSMVAMYDSRIATAPWGSGNTYSPPVRNWAFDDNFNNLAKVPPSSPQVRILLRGGWGD